MEAAKFWNKVSIKYAAKPVPDEVVYQRKLAMTKELLQADMSAVEIGCGTGSTAIINAPFVKRYYASDISDQMIAIACNKPQVAGLSGLSFNIEGIFTSLQKNPDADVILAHSLLHLLTDPEQVITSVFATLKPGGYFISSTVCMGDHLGFFKYIAPLGKFMGVMPEINVFKKVDLMKWHKNAGFELLTNWTPETNKHTSFLIAQKPK